MRPARPPRLAAIAVVVAAALALGGCLLSPGKFAASLDLRRDGRFSFTYSGEITMLALSKLASAKTAREDRFTPAPCPIDGGTDRQQPCSEKAIAEQRRRWEDGREARAASRTREAESMKAMLGGVDPADSRTVDELVARLRQQAGWRKVEYKGDGLFLVDFALSGVLGHDFRFPTMERLAMANSFVEASLRGDGTVRVDAPGFNAAAAGGPYRALIQMAAMEKAGQTPADLPQIEGTFTITTDGEILSNNTETGPTATTAGRGLDWRIDTRTAAAPMAIIRLKP